MKMPFLVCLLVLCAFTPAALAQQKFRVTKTDAEWRKVLSPEAYQVLRKSGTEAPFSGEYEHEKRAGTYFCAGCGEELFLSTTKFDSGCGWPSFYKPATRMSVLERADNSHNMRRVEIICSGCGGHLGHVFEDGPPPTHLRYCINSDALVFKPSAKAAPKTAPKAK